MFFSTFNQILCATTKENVGPKEGDVCTFDGNFNYRFFVTTKYIYVDEDKADKDCLFFTDGTTKKKIYFKLSYTWQLDHRSVFEFKGNLFTASTDVPIEMVDCDIVCYFDKNTDPDYLMAFKYDLEEKLDASLEDPTKTKAFDEVESNLLIMDNFHPFVMSVKNDKFVRTTNFIKERFRFISRKEITNEENKKEIIMELSEYYKFNRPDDVTKLQDQKLMHNVIYIQTYGLNYIRKNHTSTLLSNFVSTRKDNKIKIKTLSDKIKFEPVKDYYDYNKHKRAYLESNMFDFIRDMIKTLTDKNSDKESYYKVLSIFTSKSFDTKTCELEEFRHIKKSMDLVYIVFHTLYTEEFGKGEKPFIQFDESTKEAFFEECLSELDHLDSLGAYFTEREPIHFAFYGILKVLRTNDKLRKLFGVDGNKNAQWLKFMKNTEAILTKSFQILSTETNKIYTEKDKKAQKLKEEIDDLKEYLDAAVDNKMISMIEINNIKLHYNNIDKSDPSYPEVKTKFNKFTDFVKELNEKRDAAKVILKDMDVFITSADRLISEKASEQKKIKDMHEKGMKYDGLMKPLIGFLDAQLNDNYKKFDQMMDKLKLKITDDKEQQAVEDLLKRLEQLTAKVTQTTLDDSEAKDLEEEATKLVDQLKPHTNYLISDQQDRLKNFKEAMAKGKIKIGDVDQTKKLFDDQTIKLFDDQTKKLFDKTDKDEKMSTTKIVLIVVFSVAGVILITVLGIYLHLRRKKMMNIRMEHEIIAVDGENQ